MLCATLFEVEPANAHRRSSAAVGGAFISAVKPFSVFPFIAGSRAAVLSERLPIQWPDSESGLEQSFVIIAPFNRFMAAIHWHMSGRRSAIMRFWPDKRGYNLVKWCKHSVEAYFSSAPREHRAGCLRRQIGCFC